MRKYYIYKKNCTYISTEVLLHSTHSLKEKNSACREHGVLSLGTVKMPEGFAFSLD